MLKMDIIGKVVEEIGVHDVEKNYAKNGMKIIYLFKKTDFMIQNVVFYIVIILRIIT
jgi:hypothetical protein